jgi:hypothetical protein
VAAAARGGWGRRSSAHGSDSGDGLWRRDPVHGSKHRMRRGPIFVALAGHHRAASPELVPSTTTKCADGVGG